MASTADFIDLTTDFGFKRFVNNDQILLKFLNSALQLQDPIENIISVAQVKISALQSTREDLGERSTSDPLLPQSNHLPITEIRRISESAPGNEKLDKLIIFDVACITRTGAWVNVEMQRCREYYYYNRALYHSSRLISKQGWSGENPRRSEYYKVYGSEGQKWPAVKWEWELHPTYHIGIVDFDFSETPIADIPDEFQNSWLIWSQLMFCGDRCLPKLENKFGATDLLNICIISLPKFRATIADEILAKSSDLNKFVWIFSNLGRRGKTIPEWLEKSKDFKPVLEHLSMLRLDPSDRVMYETEVLQKRTEKDVLMTAKQDGKQEGKQEGIELGRKEGIEIGEKKGIKKGIELFKSFLNAHLGNEIIEEAYKRFVSENDPVESGSNQENSG